MEWLAGQQLEPCMRILKNYQDDYYISVEADDYFACKPWFPLEQVLELLPTRLDHGDNHYWLLIEGLGPIGKAFRFKYHAAIGDELLNPSCIYVEHKDPHLAALKLLKQVVEQYPESLKT